MQVRTQQMRQPYANNSAVMNMSIYPPWYIFTTELGTATSDHPECLFVDCGWGFRLHRQLPGLLRSRQRVSRPSWPGWHSLLIDDFSSYFHDSSLFLLRCLLVRRLRFGDRGLGNYRRKSGGNLPTGGNISFVAAVILG